MTEGDVYSRALQLLRSASTPLGFVASVNDHDNYKRIWTRDGVITGLAALLSDDDHLIKTFHSTLETIFDHQHPSGFIPSNVSPDRSVSYGGLVGRVDNPSWSVIGLCHYALMIDRTIASRYVVHVERCFQLMDAWEFNGKHLLYIPQSGDWADEYVHHGYILFDQLLRVWALRLAARTFNRVEWQEKADVILTVIKANFWNNDIDDQEQYSVILNRQLKYAPNKFWLMGFNPSQIYHQFDLQANCLALLLSLSSDVQQNKLLEFIDTAVEKVGGIPSYIPAIGEKDVAMHELKNNYAYSFRNFPHEFHNGGIWPVWNGFLVAALVENDQSLMAASLLRKLSALVGGNDFEFNECYHGVTKQPIGVPFCIWSAAGAIIAHTTIKGKKLIY